MKKKIIFSYFTQIVSIVGGIVSIPFLINRLGIESYGLIAFYISFQSVFSLLDLGLGAALSRECIRYRANLIDIKDFGSLLKVIQLTIFLIAISTPLLTGLNANNISEIWINKSLLKAEDINYCLIILSLISAIRFLSGLNRSIIIGYEKQNLLNFGNLVGAIFRYYIIIIIINHIDNIKDYFNYQLIFCLIEYVYFFAISNKLFNYRWKTTNLFIGLKILKKSLKFSLQISILSITWIIITQLDKLLISGLINLEEFGFYSVATSLAAGLLMIPGTINTVILPKITTLYIKEDLKEFQKNYITVSLAVFCIILPITIAMFYYPEQILYAWTGNVDIAVNSSYILKYYAVGNFLLAMAGMPFLLQYAKGDLKVNVIISSFYFLIFLPILYIIVQKYGLLGGCIFWIIFNFINFIINISYFHNKKLLIINKLWLRICILNPLLISSIIVAFLLKHSISENFSSRLDSLMNIFFMIVLLFFISGCYFYFCIKKYDLKI